MINQRFGTHVVHTGLVWSVRAGSIKNLRARSRAPWAILRILWYNFASWPDLTNAIVITLRALPVASALWPMPYSRACWHTESVIAGKWEVSSYSLQSATFKWTTANFLGQKAYSIHSGPLLAPEAPRNFIGRIKCRRKLLRKARRSRISGWFNKLTAAWNDVDELPGKFR